MQELPEKISSKEFKNSAHYILDNIQKIQQKLDEALNLDQPLFHEEIQKLNHQKSLYFTELGSLLRFTHAQCSEEEWETYCNELREITPENIDINPAILEVWALPEATERQNVSDLISQRVAALRKQVNVIMAMTHFQGRAKDGLTSPQEQVPQNRETMIRIVNIILRNAEDFQCSLEELSRELNFLAEFWASKENPFYDLTFLNNPTISPEGLKRYQANMSGIEQEIDALLLEKTRYTDSNVQYLKNLEDKITNRQEKLRQQKNEITNVQLGLEIRRTLAKRLLYEAQIHAEMFSKPAFYESFLRLHSLISQKVYLDPRYTYDLKRIASQDVGKFQQEVIVELENLVHVLEEKN